MATDQGRHIAALRNRARRPDDRPLRTGRADREREAVKLELRLVDGEVVEVEADDDDEPYDDEVF